ncbi:CDP-diacylglycerol--inositol 3-phosphatidyltransferase [Hypsizygus marmoreus]|uniref:CDP-diacylglycerol--inositol 3-phosphatidyltransferase n=1 Tax=Hypsizygus marmoreus TaxID=39966 RepID=A0A369JM81_HYPMA|nr:CDP-diacylglycerol--inositol 3-phosphatidyltransferase [Hypsizygus marmoreus]
MANSHSQRRRRGPSIEVVDAKVAVDLATAQTYSENVFLFVPNLIGYTRVLLAGLSLHFMTYHPKYCTLAYVVSCLLDAVDGQAARALNQTSKFGAVLDMVTDRCTTSCLLCYLASAYPSYAILFQALIALDFSSHYMHMYSSLLTGARSHKLVTSDVSRILWLYYNDSRTLFFQPIGLPYVLSELTHAQALAIVSFPICFLKNVINLVQLWKASKILVGVDLAERREMANGLYEHVAFRVCALDVDGQKFWMRSQALLRRSRSLFSNSSANPLRPSSSRRVLPTRVSRVSRKRISTATPPSADPPEDAPLAVDPSESLEKPKIRRARVSVTSSKDSESVQLPEGLDILWTPDPEQADADALHASALPPPENFDDALNNLLICLHPQTQHRAIYSSPLGAPTEPTLALSCPIEGGDYIIDATVRELARRTGAEVLVLDAVQLAAGEWGQFGPAANALSLPRNPLHFPSSSVSSSAVPSRALSAEEDDDEQDSALQVFSQPRKMTLALMATPIMQGRTILTSSSSRRNAPPSKIKVFFDTLVNTPSKSDASSSPTSSGSRPRLIYIRDFPTLAPTSSSWYPPLLSAVRERRRGPISRPSSPVSSPIAIVFGMTPPLTPPVPQSPSNSGLVSLLMSRNASAAQLSGEPKTGKFSWGEDDIAEKAREKRLRDRLKRWEKGDAALLEEFPKLSATQEGEDNDDKPDIIVIGANGIPGLSSGSSTSGNGQTGPHGDSSFFRTSVLVPKVRSIAEERAARVTRRREINELTMRMGVGAAGGIMEQESATIIHTESSPATSNIEDKPADASHHHHLRMWEDWGNRIEVWANVRRIADRALGNTLAIARISGSAEKATLDSTIVPWSAVYKAWVAHRSSKDLRTSWLKEAFSVSKPSRELDEADEGSEEDNKKQTDEVIERIKNESELDSHEQRLLSCIVDSASMPTSFDQVHLPPHTIDSVRTIVSLPLLHPQAFQQGILKQHGMTGCLLFGPPGTGKTLVVRALAKEAGCRMMTISPSDVMDMYVGEGEKLVKAVFSLARRLSPCVVFLDEIDALFGARMSARESGGAFAHRGVITEFMQEMDGLKSSKEDSVIVIGATNRPFDLDDAVLRRLPRRLLVDLPGQKEREEILKILLRDETLGDDLDISALAKKTENFSGSDLKHLCVSAALDAVKERVHLPWVTPQTTQPTPAAVTPLSEASSTPSLGGPETSEPVSMPLPSSEPPCAEASIIAADGSSTTAPTAVVIDPSPAPHSRVLHLHNFAKALTEITPSSSETLGSLAELRKWNDEFGEGRRDKKRQQFWGKGRFGFTDKGDKEGDNAKVLHSLSEPSKSTAVGDGVQ